MTAAKKVPAKKAAVKRVPKAAAKITATMKVQGRTYESKADTVLGALEGLSIGRNPHGRGILVMSNGTRTVEKVLPPIAISRLFSPSPTMRQMQLKNLFLLFNLS